MKFTLILVALAAQVLASLNCTLSGEVKTYCCPDYNSEVVKVTPPGGLIMTGCAIDDTDKGWFWNYNGLYTPFTPETKNCVYWDKRHCNLTGNTICSNASFIIEYVKKNGPGPGPLDNCNPKCVSENDFANRTWFGDQIHDSNMATDFPAWVIKDF